MSMPLGHECEGSSGRNNPRAAGRNRPDKSELREKFDSFVGESFYGQMLQAMHKTVGKAALFQRWPS